MRVPRLCRLAAGALVLGVAGPALAGPDSEVPSAADPDDAVDLHLGLDYVFETDHATIVRERAGLPGTLPSDPMPELDDLSSVHTRHVLTPRASLGVYHDLWISLALPITLSDRRELSYADGVDATSSTTVQDGLLTAAGFDADDPTTPLPAGDLLFRGPARGGLDQLYLGFGVAPMNQRRDDTKPTWKIGAEVRLAVGASAG